MKTIKTFEAHCGGREYRITGNKINISIQVRKFGAKRFKKVFSVGVELLPRIDRLWLHEIDALCEEYLFDASEDGSGAKAIKEYLDEMP